MNSTRLTLKNPKTGVAEGILLTDYTTYSQAFSFLVDSELDAYQAAYLYREFKTTVEFAEGANKWLINVKKEA